MMEQLLALLPPVPGGRPQLLLSAVFLLVFLVAQLIFLIVRSRRQEQYRWRRMVRARRYYNSRY
jgi:hypothetical protein